MARIVAIIQARLTSTRFPNKVMQIVGGKTILRRLWDAAQDSMVDRVIVAWPEGFPELDENDVLGRFQKIAQREHADVIVRLTSDCPLITTKHIDEAIRSYNIWGVPYFCNRIAYQDGLDVQVFNRGVLFDETMTDREHVIKPQKWPTDLMPKLSVDTKADLERVRKYA